MEFSKEMLLVRADFIQEFSQAWELNDRAHRVGHFDNVALAGIHINKKLGLGYPERLILVVAYLHDLFAWSRDNHHLLSEEFVRGTENHLLQKYCHSPEEFAMVSKACGQHRASFNGKFYNSFCELMNAADREAPKSLDSMIARAVMYHMDRNTTATFEEAQVVSEHHMYEKFGREGYARYPMMYHQVFGADLEALWDKIDKLPANVGKTLF